MIPAGVASALQALVHRGWRIPPLFQAALRDPALHTAQHLCVLAAGSLPWWAMLARGRPA